MADSRGARWREGKGSEGSVEGGGEGVQGMHGGKRGGALVPGWSHRRSERRLVTRGIAVWRREPNFYVCGYCAPDPWCGPGVVLGRRWCVADSWGCGSSIAVHAPTGCCDCGGRGLDGWAFAIVREVSYTGWGRGG